MIGTPANASFEDKEKEMSLYRRRFPFQLSEEARCVLFEENEELSVKIYRTSGRKHSFHESESAFIVLDRNRKEKIGVRLERRECAVTGGSCICLFSERFLHWYSNAQKDNDAYYTLHISDKSGAIALFRAFTANKTVAVFMFERLCALDIQCLNAIDLYREERARILREVWFGGL